MPHTNGVLSATTAFGKTVTAAALIAQRKINTLILVHSKALLMQWHERLSEFLDIDFIEDNVPKKRGRKKVFSPVGSLDSTSNTLHGVVDVALMQSCFEDGEVKSFVQDYGMVIVDECHHVSSITFENVLKHVTAHYVYGLTATQFAKTDYSQLFLCNVARFDFQLMLRHRYKNNRFNVILCRGLLRIDPLQTTNIHLRHSHNHLRNLRCEIISS